MRVPRKKRGFSIVEEIASIAIIMLVAVVFLNSILASTKLVSKSGNRTKDVSEAEKRLGNAIQNGSEVDVIKGTSATSKKIVLNLGSLGLKEVSGTTYTYTDATGKNKTSLSTFLPN